MTLHPYEITFLQSPRARKRRTWIRFAPSVVAALDGAKKAAKEEHPQAHSWICVGHGKDAEARVHGVLRGGRVFRDRFYFHGPDPRAADLADVTDLKYQEEADPCPESH
jgi:hypothetical protein